MHSCPCRITECCLTAQRQSPGIPPAHHQESGVAFGGAVQGPGEGPDRTPSPTRSTPCAPQKPSSSTSSGSRPSSASPSTSAVSPGPSGNSASSGRTSSTPGERADVREHFLGPVMYLAAVDPLNAHWSPYLVYDGQQRLTTVSLILEALARHLRDGAARTVSSPRRSGTTISSMPSAKGTINTGCC